MIREKIAKIITATWIISTMISIPLVASGQGIKDKTMLKSIASKAGVSDQANAQDLVGTVIKAILSISGLIFLILMVYAGILWMTARGDEANVTKAKDIIEAAVIGLFLTVSAYAITVFVTSRFQSTPPKAP